MTDDRFFIYYMDDSVIADKVSKRNVIPRQVKISLTSSQKAEVHFANNAMNFSLCGEHFSFSQSETTLVGPHNLINTMAAVSATYLAGVSLESMREGLKSFRNAPHRLESVGTVNGVDFVNDSKATNVDSVVYALGSYDRPLIWIAGGIDKGNDYSKIEEQVKQKVKALICLGKDNEKLKKAFKGIVRVIKETQDVKDLVHLAMEQAESGDVVLLSPACASFDLFRNYEDRGDQFREAVKELKVKNEQ
jgi:UDP-N-acetylmuramoylalanine--D-glutamate ligase